MKKTLSFVLAAGIIASAQAAPTNKEIATCAVLEGDLSRLECYDNLAQRYGLDGPQAQPVEISGQGKWDVNVDINPVDDSKTVTLMLMSDEGVNRWGRSIAFIARCQSNKTDVYIVWGGYLGRESNVLTRIGNETAQTRRWSMSTDSRATFHPEPIVFLKSMMDSDKLVTQVTPYNESPVTAVFDTAGLSMAIEPLRETCNW